MRDYDYLRPQSLDELWKLKEQIPGSLFIAGGTDLLLQIRNREVFPQALISLRQMPELAGIEVGETTRIGALTTISDLIQHPLLGKKYPVLIEAAKCLGSVQIRNVATIGGNLCNSSPCADMATPLLVLEARVRLQKAKKIREIPISEFFLDAGKSCLAPNELLTDIFLNPAQSDEKALFLKKGRVKMDLAIASVAILLQMDGKKCRKARLAAGSVAPVPLRLPEVEVLLEGAELSKKVLAKAQKTTAKSIFPITDIRGSEEYRRHICGVLVNRGLENLIQENEE